METMIESNTSTPSLSDRQWAAAAHIAAFVLALATSWFAGIAGALGALGVWMLVRDKSPFAVEHAKEALNFNLSMFIYAVISIALIVVTLGIGIIVALPFWFVLGLVWLVCSLIATFKAYDGQTYRYPLSMRLIR